MTRLMPPGFRQCELGDFLQLKRGYDLPHRDRREGDVPIVSSSGPTGVHDVAKVEGPGVVTGRYGTLGEVFYVSEDFWPLNTALYVRDFKGNHPRFVAYLLRTLGLGGQNVAGAVPGVNRNVLHRMHVVVPDRARQERIADVLQAYDDLIENNQRRMTLLEESVHLLHREWFSRLRFPGFERTRLVDGIPEGWRHVGFGDLVETPTDRVEPAAVEPATPYIGLEHIPRKSIAQVEWGTASDVASSKLRFARGDILFGKIRPYFHKVSVAPIDGITSSDTIVMRAASPDVRGLAIAVAASELFVEHSFQTAKVGSKMPRANWTSMAQFGVLLPSASVLSEFNEFVCERVALIERLVFQNRRLAEARDALLPRLMNGSIAV